MGEVLTCYNCSVEIAEGEELNGCDNNVYCQECWDELYTCCDHCGDTVDLEYSHYQDDTMFCESCYNERYTECWSCSDVILLDNANEYNSRYYCSDCFYENFGMCEDCQEYYRIEDLTYDDGYGYCSECYEGNNWIKNYSYKPSPIFRGKPIGKRYIGIELECEFKNADDYKAESIMSDYPDIYCKHDSSLDNGFEIVSHPFSLEYHQSFGWDDMFMELSRIGVRSHETPTCGLHVHISKSVFTKTDLLKLSVFGSRCSEWINKFSRRDYGHFCYMPEYQEKIQTLIRRGYISNDSRYEAINFQNNDTVEFRMFKGTLKYTSFMGTLEFVDAVSHWIKTMNTCQMLKSHHTDIVASLKKFVENKPCYKNLNNYMVERGI